MEASKASQNRTEKHQRGRYGESYVSPDQEDEASTGDTLSTTASSLVSSSTVSASSTSAISPIRWAGRIVEILLEDRDLRDQWTTILDFNDEPTFINGISMLMERLASHLGSQATTAPEDQMDRQFYASKAQIAPILLAKLKNGRPNHEALRPTADPVGSANSRNLDETGNFTSTSGTAAVTPTDNAHSFALDPKAMERLRLDTERLKLDMERPEVILDRLESRNLRKMWETIRSNVLDLFVKKREVKPGLTRVSWTCVSRIYQQCTALQLLTQDSVVGGSYTMTIKNYALGRCAS